MISEKDYNDIYQKGYEDGKNDNITKIEYAIKPSFTTRKLKQLQQENKQLKDNWNKLKEWLNEDIDINDCEHIEKALNKMQELENGENNE